MAETVTASVIPGLTVSVRDTTLTGLSGDVTFKLPAGLVATAFANGLDAAEVTVRAWAKIDLLASTPQTFDLTALPATTWYGAAGVSSIAFTKIKAFQILPLTVGDSGDDLTFSGGASNPWVGPLGGTAPTYTIKAGGSWVHHDLSTAGMVVSAGVKSFKLDPGAAVISCYIALVGN